MVDGSGARLPRISLGEIEAPLALLTLLALAQVPPNGLADFVGCGPGSELRLYGIELRAASSTASGEERRRDSFLERVAETCDFV